MMKLLAVLLLAVPAPDDKEALAKAVAQAAAAESYSYKTELDFQSAFGGAPPNIPNLSGAYQKDVGLHIKSDRGEIFKKGDRMFLKMAESDWQDAAQLQGALLQPGADPTNKQGRARLFGGLMIRTLKSPHDELTELAKGLKSVKKGEKAEKLGDRECTEYSGELTDEAMKASPLGRMVGTFGGAGATITGSAKIWVDSQGNIAFFEVINKASLEFQNNAIEVTISRKNEITDIGKTKVEVPEAVQKLLAAPKVKSEDKPEEKKEN